MKNKILDIFISLSLGLGTIFLLSPLALYWWINNDQERYLWIIQGPNPYNQFGSGPIQLAIYIGLSLLGIALLAISWLGNTFSNRSNSEMKKRASIFLVLSLLILVLAILLFSQINHVREKAMNTSDTSESLVKTAPSDEYQVGSDKTNICISIFSGRPDPCIDLSDQQSKELVRKIMSLPDAGSDVYIQDVGLGYRGIHGVFSEKSLLSTDKSSVSFQVIEGLVAYNPTAKAYYDSMNYLNEPNPNLIYKVDKNRELEKWLISLIDVDPQTQKLVEELLQELK